MLDKISYWCKKILPLVYDDSLSYYEVLCKVTEKLNEVISEVNGVDEKIRSEIKNYVQTDEFKSYVEALVSEYVTKRDTPPRSNDMDIHRIFSKIEKSSIAFPGETHYNVPQSICYIPDNNSIIVAWGLEGTASTTSALARLEELSLSDMHVIRTATIAIYHANGMCYDSATRKIYVCGLNDITVGNTNGHGVIVVDYATLTVEKSVLLPINPVGCAIDGGLLYFADGTGHITITNTTDYTPIREITLERPENIGTVYQDIDIHNGLLYCVYWRPATIGVFDLSGHFVRMYNIPKWWDRIYRAYEPEGICFTTGDNCLITSYMNNEPGHYTGEGIIGIANFAKNVQNAPTNEIGYYSIQSAYDLYVDSSSANSANINPIGDRSSPFRSVQEALTTAKSPYINGAVNINIVAGEEPYPLAIHGVNKKLRILGKSYIFDNITVTSCEYVSIASNSRIISTVNDTAAVTVSQSEILLTDVAIEKEDCTYDISATASDISLSYPNIASPGCIFTNCTIRLNRINDTSKIIANDSMCDINRPITLAEGEYTSTFTTRFDAKRLPYATIMLSASDTWLPYEFRTNPKTNQKITARYESAGHFYDVYCSISFNTDNNITLYGVYHRVDGGETISGFPADCYIAAVYLHN